MKILSKRELIRELRSQGFRVETSARGHCKVYPKDVTLRMITMAPHSRDPRAYKNIVSALRSVGFEPPGASCPSNPAPVVESSAPPPTTPSPPAFRPLKNAPQKKRTPKLSTALQCSLEEKRRTEAIDPTTPSPPPVEETMPKSDPKPNRYASSGPDISQPPVLVRDPPLDLDATLDAFNSVTGNNAQQIIFVRVQEETFEGWRVVIPRSPVELVSDTSGDGADPSSAVQSMMASVKSKLRDRIKELQELEAKL